MLGLGWNGKFDDLDFGMVSAWVFQCLILQPLILKIVFVIEMSQNKNPFQIRNSIGIKKLTRIILCFSPIFHNSQFPCSEDK
jgi:hypothetical protein